jgi:hypothetical protein
VLLKAVLETQPVYWLALAHVPISVLNTIVRYVLLSVVRC